MSLSGVKEKIYYKKMRLEIIKNNLSLLKNDCQFKSKFYISPEYFGGITISDISQSKYSLALLFSALKYPDAKTCFFVELFNFYQDLEKNELYRSFSQSLTTYMLKLLSRNNLIDFNCHQKQIETNLNEYARIIGNYNFIEEEKSKMYIVNFYKLSSLKEDDLPLIKSITNILGINFNDLVVYHKYGEMYLRLKRIITLKQVFSLTYFKKMFKQREIFFSILSEYKDYIFEDFNDYKRNLKY